MFTLFQGNREDKLKALKIAEKLADKSTLPILRKGLRDISPEVVEISAFLIRKFNLRYILEEMEQILYFFLWPARLIYSGQAT